MINSVQKSNIIENLTYFLVGAQGDLRNLKKNNGDTSLLKEWVSNLKAEIARIEAQDVKEVTQKTAISRRANEIREMAAISRGCKKDDVTEEECVKLAEWEIRVGGQVVFPACEETPQPEPEVIEEVIEEVNIIEVDKELLNRLDVFFDTTARFFKGQNRQRVYYGSISEHTTVYAMMTKGVKGGFVKGMSQITKNNDYMTKLNEMLRLAAVCLIVTAPATLKSEPVNKFCNISEAMIDEYIERIISRQTVV